MEVDKCLWIYKIISFSKNNKIEFKQKIELEEYPDGLQDAIVVG